MNQSKPLSRVIAGAALALLLCNIALAQNDFATGNMHFDAHEMDTNGDRMISREEMLAYAEKTWEMMAHGKDTLSIDAAAHDFASGGVSFDAHAIDTDHDGTISKAEYLAYSGRKFDSMAHGKRLVPVEEMAKAFARGNTEATAHKSQPDAAAPK
ncbi:MAG: EF-hand domain-containing protein [Sinobacteraceae bacterium]|nr:EF-hand domain-containing protein [Nevskiaceae bacterium]MBV9912268.1 EF-hand domain-containing protein [Nevskiaceae bacterium]